MALEEKRLTHLENSVDTLTGLSMQLFDMQADNKAMMVQMDARLTAHEVRHEARMKLLEERHAAHDAEIAELRRDGQQLQRIWIRVARKNGWTDLLDEEE